MIHNNGPTDKQIDFLLYAICDESYEKMCKVSATIDHYCMVCDTIWVEEMFQLVGMECPADLKNYGWTKPRRYLDEGYFYLYCGLPEEGGSENELWHIKFSKPEKLSR